MNNHEKIILDLFGGTGSWSKPYKNAGYDVRLITLPENDVMEYIPPQYVYGILAACPCEVISNCAAHLRTQRTYNLVMKHCAYITRTLIIILETSPTFWCIENPPGDAKKLLGPPQYKFQPYEFGEKYTKQTYLWGKFNPPMKKFTDAVNKKSNIIENMLARHRNVKRAITPASFADAFFEANK